MNDLMQVVIRSGLDLPILKNSERNALLEIPNKCFGIFVTVKRSDSQSLDEYPKNIHGCMGYWSDEYNELNKEEILSQIKRVSRKSTFKDKRKDYFIKPIEEDSFATYELHFMKTPLIEINKTTGMLSNDEKFDNSKYGLIAIGEDGKRSTYLPNVFINKKWDWIKKNLIKKSGSKGECSFKAYKTDTRTECCNSLLSSSNLKNMSKNSIDFIVNNYGDFIPYIINSNGVEVDRDKNIRNVAMLNIMLDFVDDLPNNVLYKVKEDLEFYQNRFKDLRRRMRHIRNVRQASAFLALALNKIEKRKEAIDICDYLYESINDLEPKFELGEVMVSLSEVDPRKNELWNSQRDMYSNLVKKEFSKISIDDIFECNWQSQSLNSLYRSYYINEDLPISKIYIKHAMELKKRALYIYSHFSPKIQTNYLAVTLECLCSLLHIVHWQTNQKNEILNNIQSVFCKLQRRYTDGLYYFTNGDSRLDITGHVLNSFKILKNNKISTKEELISR